MFWLGLFAGGAVVSVGFYTYHRYAVSATQKAYAVAQDTLARIKVEYGKLKSGLQHDLDRLISKL